MFNNRPPTLNHDRLPEPMTGYPEIKRTVFRAAGVGEKNKEARVSLLNDVAHASSTAFEGRIRPMSHWVDRKGRRHRLRVLNNSGWKAAPTSGRQPRYQEELGGWPEGFRRVRVHDLKHTCGRRLRAAGVAWRIGQDLTGATRAAASRPTTALRRSAISLA